MKRRALSMLLALCMALSFAACGGRETLTQTEPPAPTPAVTPTQAETPTEAPESVDEEIADAIAAGLVPEELRGDYDKQVIYREYCALLDALVEKARPDALADWLEASADFRDSAHTMTRFEGMLLLLYAAECMDLDAEGFRMMLILSDVAGDAYWDDMFSHEVPEEKDGYSTVGWERISQLYYNEIIANSEWYWRCEHDYVFNSVMFGAYCSYQNGRPYFDYDEHFLLRPGNDLTREAAIHAVSRLYGTAIYATFEPYDGTRFQLSGEALRQAAAMPEVSCHSLPDWHGFSFMNMCELRGIIGIEWDEEYVDVMKGCGFNFVRVPLDMNRIFALPDVTRVCAAELENISSFIDYCAKNQIHVCLDLHDMLPYFVTGGTDNRNDETLFTDAAAQELFANCWGFLADYYRDVPASALSFNLLNEPHLREDGMPSDEVYSHVMRMGIDAVHAVTPDRLIFVDVMGVFDGNPIEGLADQPIVQAIHIYPLDDTAQYPNYKICERITRAQGPVEFRGNFPAGTTISIDVNGIDVIQNGADSKSELSFVADGKTVGAFEFREATEFRTWSNGEHVITATLAEPASVIQIVQGGGEWYFHDWIVLETDQYTIQLSADMTYQFVSDESPVLTVAADGSFTVDKPRAIYTLDIDAIRQTYAKYADFTARTGQLFMIQEFGYNGSIPDAAACPMAEDYFTVWEELGMPWCVWDGSYCPVIGKKAVYYEDTFGNSKPLHDDGEYEDASENYLVDTRLMDAFQRHMK